MYTVIWKYKIQAANRKKFEEEYGSNGTWAKFFSDSEKYKGSFLHKSQDETDSYILIDTWTDKNSYEVFIKMNSGIYARLSSDFKTIHEKEERVGSFS